MELVWSHLGAVWLSSSLTNASSISGWIAPSVVSITPYCSGEIVCVCACVCVCVDLFAEVVYGLWREPSSPETTECEESRIIPVTAKQRKPHTH